MAIITLLTTHDDASRGYFSNNPPVFFINFDIITYFYRALHKDNKVGDKISHWIFDNPTNTHDE